MFSYPYKCLENFKLTKYSYMYQDNLKRKCENKVVVVVVVVAVVVPTTGTDGDLDLIWGEAQDVDQERGKGSNPFMGRKGLSHTFQ